MFLSAVPLSTDVYIFICFIRFGIRAFSFGVLLICWVAGKNRGFLSSSRVGKVVFVGCVGLFSASKSGAQALANKKDSGVAFPGVLLLTVFLTCPKPAFGLFSFLHSQGAKM